MSRHDPKARLLHMRDFAEKAVQLTNGKTRAELESDEVLRLAVTRLLELIGEAATHIPAEICDRHPEIPWPKIVSMRNRLIHGYDEVDYDPLGCPHLKFARAAGTPPESHRRGIQHLMRCYKSATVRNAPRNDTGAALARTGQSAGALNLSAV